VSDDNNKTMLGISPFREEADGEGEGGRRPAASVEQRLAQQRRQLALKTRPMEALADLDWDLPDDVAPTPSATLPQSDPPAATSPVADAPVAATSTSEAPASAEPSPSIDRTMMLGPGQMEALRQGLQPAEPSAGTPIEPQAAVQDVSPRGGTLRMSASDVANLSAGATQGDSISQPASAPAHVPSGTLRMSAAEVRRTVPPSKAPEGLQPDSTVREISESARQAAMQPGPQMDQGLQNIPTPASGFHAHAALGLTDRALAVGDAAAAPPQGSAAMHGAGPAHEVAPMHGADPPAGSAPQQAQAAYPPPEVVPHPGIAPEHLLQPPQPQHGELDRVANEVRRAKPMAQPVKSAPPVVAIVGLITALLAALFLIYWFFVR